MFGRGGWVNTNEGHALGKDEVKMNTEEGHAFRESRVIGQYKISELGKHTRRSCLRFKYGLGELKSKSSLMCG